MTTNNQDVFRDDQNSINVNIDKIEVKEITNTEEKLIWLQEHAQRSQNYVSMYALDFAGEDNKMFSAYHYGRFCGFSRLCKYKFMFNPQFKGPFWGLADIYFRQEMHKNEYLDQLLEETFKQENVQVAKIHLPKIFGVQKILAPFGFTRFVIYPKTNTAMFYDHTNSNIRSDLDYEAYSINELDSPDFCQTLKWAEGIFDPKGFPMPK